MKKLSLIIIAVGAMTGAFSALAAPAPTPPPGAFLSPGQDDKLVVFDNLGNIYKQTVSIEGLSAEGSHNPFIVDSNTGNGTLNGHFTVFTEIGNPNNWTDVVGVIPTPGSPGNFELVFFSDSNSEPNGLDQNAIVNFFLSMSGAAIQDGTILESLNPTNITQYVNSSFTGFSGWFVSDIPDGGMTVALLGMALGAVEVLRRKFKAA